MRADGSRATGCGPQATTSCASSRPATSSPGLTDERALLERALRARPARPARAARRASTTASGQVAEIELELEEGLGFAASLDPATAGLLAALDGTRTLAEVVAELARLEGTSRAAVEQAAVPVTASMLAAGFLERVD